MQRDEEKNTEENKNLLLNKTCIYTEEDIQNNILLS